MKFVKAILRSIFRYKLTAIFFIMGQVVVYVTILGALGIYNKAYQKEQDRVNSQYKNRIEMNVVKLNKSDIISSCNDNVECGNVILKNVSLYFGERNGDNRKPEIIISMNEQNTYEMVSGRLPGTEPEDKGKKIVALGRSQFKYAYEEEGEYYVTFENEKYQVIGIIGNKNSDYLDYAIVFNENCIGDNVRTVVNNMKKYTILLGSNKYELDSTYKAVYNNLIRADANAVIESKSISGNGQSVVDSTLQKENISINYIVFIFCMINCMLMSEFWIIERKKEFAIRRTYGYSRLKIIAAISRDIIVLGILSFVIYIVGHGVVSLIFESNVYSIEFDIKTMASIIFINITALISTLIVPVYRIMKMNPADILGDIE